MAEQTVKTIRVSEEVHEKVSQVANANFRGLGDQVAYWAAHSCAHPLESRTEIRMVVSEVVQATKKSVARVGEGQPFRGFFCADCKQHVIPDLPEDVNRVFNQPIVDVAK